MGNYLKKTTVEVIVRDEIIKIYDLDPQLIPSDSIEPRRYSKREEKICAEAELLNSNDFFQIVDAPYIIYYFNRSLLLNDELRIEWNIINNASRKLKMELYSKKESELNASHLFGLTFYNVLNNEESKKIFLNFLNELYKYNEDEKNEVLLYIGLETGAKI